jgi:hypothetical protein
MFLTVAVTGGRSVVAATQTTGVVVAAAGDIADCTASGVPTASTEATAALLDAIVPDGVLTLGDNAYESGTIDEFLCAYDPTWGRHLARTYPSPGNREYRTPGAAGHFQYFGARAGDPAKGYYSFDLGSWHLVSLNSNCSEIGGCDAGSPQEQWLRQDLAATAAPCILGFFHHARFSSVAGTRSSMLAFWQAFYDYGGDVVLSGHDHVYERFAPQTPDGTLDTAQGIREFVVGTGGKSLTSFQTLQPNSEARNNTDFGVLKLVLGTDGYEWAFVPEAGGTFTDSGSDPCHAAPADTTPPSSPANLVATGTSDTIELTWNASSDNVGVAAYDVYRDGSLLATKPGGTTSHSDTTAATGVTYTYEVRARDAAGNVSPPSNAASAARGTASTLTLPADADARVVEGSPSTNFGTAPELIADLSPNTESYLRFVVSGVSGTITSAKLRLFAFDLTTDGPGVYSADSSWVESTITWSNKPARTGGPVANAGSIAQDSWVEFNVTAAVTGNGSYTFNLVPDSSNGVDFYSREATNPNKPQLVLAVSSTDAPPETQIDTGPPTLTSSTSATFTFSANEPATFACSLDGAPFSACLSGTTYPGLQDGAHSFQVQATDLAGNADPTPASRSWQVDTTVPAVTTTSPQAGASDVDPGTLVQAVFSEPMDPASINGSSFTLEQSGAGPVSGTVAYDAATRTANFTPTSPLPAPASLTARVTSAARDLAGNPLAADVVWSFTTVLVNHAPTVNAGPDQTITLPAGAALDGTVSDDGLPSPSSLTSSWSQVSGPGTVSFGNASAVDTSAGFSAAGSYVLQLQASDGELTTSDTVAITVNQAPAITSDGGGDSASLSVAENASAVTTVTASDPDPGDTLSYSIVPGADAAAFTIVGASGVLTFASAPNFEAPSDTGGNNVYDVTVQASDGKGGSDTQALAVTVTNVPEPPSITSNGGGPSATVSKPENQTQVTDVDATDPDAGDTVTYSIVPGGDAAAFQIDAASGLLSFLSAPDYEAPTDANTNNVYEVMVQASDGALTDSQAIAVTVTDVNENPAPLYFSLRDAATVGGVSAANEDIIAFDGISGFSLFFDGSDVGLGSRRLDAFTRVDQDTLLLSFDTDGAVLPGIAETVDDSDVVQFDATSLGPNTTAGAFSMYFDGSDVGLTTSSHDLDSVELLPDGTILLSTTGSLSVSGVAARDEDLLAFTASSLGPTTAGSFAMYFDGGDVGLGGEDVDAAAVDSNGNIYLSTTDVFAVTGVSGDDEDVFVFDPTTTGPTTAGSYLPTLYFDGSAFGIAANDVYAIDLP